MGFFKKNEKKADELLDANEAIELSDDALEDIAGGVQDKRAMEYRVSMLKPTGEVDMTSMLKPTGEVADNL